MDAKRSELMPGVFLTSIQTQKFKTNILSINLITQLTRENAAKNAVLPEILPTTFTHSPDMLTPTAYSLTALLRYSFGRGYPIINVF